MRTSNAFHHTMWDAVTDSLGRQHHNRTATTQACGGSGMAMVVNINRGIVTRRACAASP